jgi:hypothetical protein
MKSVLLLTNNNTAYQARQKRADHVETQPADRLRVAKAQTASQQAGIMPATLFQSNPRFFTV